MPTMRSDKETPQQHPPPGGAATRGSSPAQTRGPRRYAFACASCKARKVKCSGEQPVCAGCQRSGDECVWPTQNKTHESQQLRDAQDRIRHLEQDLRRQSASRANRLDRRWRRAAKVNANFPKDRRLDSQAHQDSLTGSSPIVSASDPQRGGLRGNARRTGDSAVVPDYSTPRTLEQADRRLSASGATDPALETSLWYQTGIGEDGDVVYNGPTSRFHAGSLLEDNRRDDDDGTSSISTEGIEKQPTGDAAREIQHAPDDGSGHTDILQAQYHLMDSVWMPLIAAKPEMSGTGVDTKTGIILLDIYWAWLHPLHNLVYRPVFLMDLALGGPHCSPFLLLCIFGLAARHLPSGIENGHSTGEQYVARARELLLEEMTASTPSIPTIQGLLILGGRQCAIGRSSQGWLYTGMAIRMMQDIGLHLDTTGLSGLAERRTAAELETRKRLYNSAYIWDKTLSLALGRPPSLIRRPYPESDILDKFDDQRMWKPIHALEVSESFTASPSWTTSTFNVFCQLHEIATDMMLLFSSTTSDNVTAKIHDLDMRFCQWYERIPSHLKIDDPFSLRHSPPPHIVSLNLLYHALHILLRRPFISTFGNRREHAHHCIHHSKKIYAIHTVYTQTFPHRLMTYQVSYCIYTAATVEVLELKRWSMLPTERQEAAERLAAGVRILQHEAEHTPGSGRSLDTIRRLLSEGRRQKHHDLHARASSQGGRRSAPRRQQRRQSKRPASGAEVDTGAPERDTLFEAMGQIGQPSGGYFSRQTHDHPLPTPSQSRDTLTLDGTHSNELFVTEDAALGLQYVPCGDDFNSIGGFWDDLRSLANMDTGAGFHPESSSWGMPDEVQRTSNLQLASASQVAHEVDQHISTPDDQQ